MSNRSGILKSNLSGYAEYKSFVPAKLPPVPQISLESETVSLLVKANIQLAVLETKATHIPNINLFISMYVRKEALMSSQIEGTQATLEDILDPFIEKNFNQNVSDVIHYIKATEYAIARLDELPLCNRLIQEAHAVLMQGARGQNKSPGTFRHSQNWIGGRGSTLQNAGYIPPTPEDMIEAMSDLEKYINSDDDLDILIRAGLIHYQFETIHPFLDGNGRVGRLLITLFLMKKKFLTTPVLYISYFLKKNRIDYYDRMTEVRNKGNYEQWVNFFLEAIYESAKDASETIDKLMALHNTNENIIRGLDRTRTNTNRIFEYIEANPIIEIQKTASALKIAYNTVAAGIERLCDVGILEKSSGKRRNRTYSYKSYLDILREGT